MNRPGNIDWNSLKWYEREWRTWKSQFVELVKLTQPPPDEEAEEELDRLRTMTADAIAQISTILLEQFDYAILYNQFLTDTHKATRSEETVTLFFELRLQYYLYTSTLKLHDDLVKAYNQNRYSASDMVYRINRTTFKLWEYLWPNLCIWNFLDMGRQAGRMEEAIPGAVKSLAGWEAAGIKLYPRLRAALKHKYADDLQKGLLTELLGEALAQITTEMLHPEEAVGYAQRRTEAARNIEKMEARNKGISLDELGDVAGRDSQISQFIDMEDACEQINRANLSPAERDVIELLLQEPSLYHDSPTLARLLGRSQSTVRVQMRNAIRKIQTVGR